jgi:chitinase
MFDKQKPKFVTYILNHIMDTNVNEPSNNHLKFLAQVQKFNESGINVIILSFIKVQKYVDPQDFESPKTPTPIYTENGNSKTQIEYDTAVQDWVSFSPEQRQAIKNAFNGVILVSHGGYSWSGAIYTYSKIGLKDCSDITWNFINNFSLDGVDIDYENVSTNTDLKDFSTLLAQNKPDNMLYTMAPQMTASEMNYHKNIYAQVPGKIDWFNIQCYNQNADYAKYQNIMIDSQVEASANSIRSLIVGTALPGNPYCGNVQCPKFTPIPYYKIILGSCINNKLEPNNPVGCAPFPDSSNDTPDLISSYITQAKTDPNFTTKEWFNGGGMMVWAYRTDLDTYNNNNLTIDTNVNTNTLNSLNIASTNFKYDGSIPIQPPSPITQTTSPGTKSVCDNCLPPYGKCINGICNCKYGYSGTNCDNLPICNDSAFNPIIFPVIEQTTPTISNSKSTANKYIIYILLSFILIGVISVPFTIKSSNKLTLSLSIIFISIIFLVIYLLSNKTKVQMPSTTSNVIRTTTPGNTTSNVIRTTTPGNTTSNIINTTSPGNTTSSVINTTTPGNTTSSVINTTTPGNTTNPVKTLCTENSCGSGYVCMREDGKRISSQNPSDGTELCVPCSDSSSSSSANSKRLIAYWEGWRLPHNSDSIDSTEVYDYNFGDPKNYTHMIFAFIVPYHFWGGSCSKLCTPWDATDDIEGNYGVVKNHIKSIKEINPSIKILLSFGGWNFTHMSSVWFKDPARFTPEHAIMKPGCNFLCDYTSDPDADFPAKYISNQGNCKANTDKDSSGNFAQPSYYCYGDGAVGGVVATATRVANKIKDLIEYVGADGLDIDIEDSKAYSDSNSNVFTFIETITKNLYNRTITRTGDKIILSQAPINGYVVNDISLNPYWSSVIGDNYNNMLRRLVDPVTNKSMLDFISIQFYNGPPEALDNPEDVKKAYNNIVKDVFNGDASRVVVGLCSFPESTSLVSNPTNTGKLSYPTRPSSTDKVCYNTNTSCKENSDCPNGICAYPFTGNYTCNNCVGNEGEYLCSDPNFKGAYGKSRFDLIKELSDEYPKFGGVMFWASPGDDPLLAQPEYINGVPYTSASWSLGRFSLGMRNAMGLPHPTTPGGGGGGTTTSGGGICDPNDRANYHPCAAGGNCVDGKCVCNTNCTNGGPYCNC